MYDPIYIKKLPVYAEQREAAHTIMSYMNKGISNIILRAKPQCGKTTTFIYLAKLAMDEWLNQGIKFKIYSVLADADNELIRQTKQRWNDAGFNSYHYSDIIGHYHRSQFKNISPDNDDQKRLIIIDEAHIANAEDSQLHQFLKNLEYDYKNGENTGSCENYVLSVSATPYGQLSAAIAEFATFHFVDLRASNDYYGLDQAERDDRLKDPVNLLRKIGSGYQVTEEVSHILTEFKNSQENKNLVVRLSGQGKKSKAFIDKCRDLGLITCEFHSSNRNLDEVDQVISSEPTNGPTVIVIYGALRAGKTLETTKYIYAWIDSKNSKADTAYQSAGRLFGYKTFDGHSKFEDRFPIYANKKSLEQVLKYDEEGVEIPDGGYNCKTKIKYIYEPVEAEVDETGHYSVYEAKVTGVNKDGVVVLDVKERYPNDGNHYTSSEYRDGRNFAEYICDRSQWDYKRGVTCDGPSSSTEHSWNKLMELHPEFKGRTVVMKPVGAELIHRVRKDAIYA